MLAIWLMGSYNEKACGEHVARTNRVETSLWDFVIYISTLIGSLCAAPKCKKVYEAETQCEWGHMKGSNLCLLLMFCLLLMTVTMENTPH